MIFQEPNRPYFALLKKLTYTIIKFLLGEQIMFLKRAIPGPKPRGGANIRSLWTGLEQNPEFYCHAKQEKIVINTHFFNTSTLRGHSLVSSKSFSIFGFLMNAYPQGFLYRGMNRKEERDYINQQVHGLAGSKPLIAYVGGTKEIDLEKTREIAKAHRAGNVSGISTSKKLGIGISFANYLPQTHAVYLVDKRNIPESQQVHQDYSDELDFTDASGENQNYTHERELTVSGVHASAIPMRLTRDGLTFNVECNPFYVDRLRLSEGLNQEYEVLLESFYEVIYDVRRNQHDYSVIQEPDMEKLKKFKEQEEAFYAKWMIEMDVDPQHRKAITERLSGTLSIEELTEGEIKHNPTKI